MQEKKRQNNITVQNEGSLYLQLLNFKIFLPYYITYSKLYETLLLKTSLISITDGDISLYSTSSIVHLNVFSKWSILTRTCLQHFSHCQQILFLIQHLALFSSCKSLLREACASNRIIMFTEIRSTAFLSDLGTPETRKIPL